MDPTHPTLVAPLGAAVGVGLGVSGDGRPPGWQLEQLIRGPNSDRGGRAAVLHRLHPPSLRFSHHHARWVLPT